MREVRFSRKKRPVPLRRERGVSYFRGGGGSGTYFPYSRNEKSPAFLYFSTSALKPL